MSGRSEVDVMQGFIDARGVDGFPHIADESGDVWDAFNIRSQPAFVFINGEGEIVSTTGPLGESGIDEQIEALIAS